MFTVFSSPIFLRKIPFFARRVEGSVTLQVRKKNVNSISRVYLNQILLLTPFMKMILKAMWIGKKIIKIGTFLKK